MLRDKYFSFRGLDANENSFEYTVTLNPEHEIYNGHFPGRPVSPGVCSIQMIRECCEDALCKPMKITAISTCRFLNVLTPAKGKALQIKLNLNEEEDRTVKVDASICNEETTFVTLKCTLSPKDN